MYLYPFRLAVLDIHPIFPLFFYLRSVEIPIIRSDREKGRGNGKKGKEKNIFFRGCLINYLPPAGG